MKKLLSLSLALIMTMALTGCVQEDEHKEQETGGVPNPFSEVSNNEIFNDEIGINIEIVDEARPITEEELTYFNETYFNTATGENINIANQFLHGTFEKPQDIDLFNLFYLGTGAEYAMSEDGEYEAVAKAFGYDTWLEMPTDVTPSPVSGMDYILNYYTGTSFEDSNKVGLDNYKYLEDYDCYYNMHGDINYYGNVEFVGGTVKGNIYHLHYHNSVQNDFEGADYILTLTKSDENYLIQSNLPMMIEE